MPVKVARDCSLTTQTDMSNPPAREMEKAVMMVDKACCRKLRKTISQSVISFSPRAAWPGLFVSSDWTDFELRQDLAVVADQQKGGPVFPASGANQGQRFAGVLMVKVSGGFVGQHQLGAVGQRTSHRHSLLLSGGQLAGVMF